MRRLVSTLVAFALLANVAVWPSTALAELLAHQQAPVGFVDPVNAPATPDPAHRHHQCAGHFGEHFQGQLPAAVIGMRHRGAELPVPATPTAHPQPNPVLPFRPPLAASNQS